MSNQRKPRSTIRVGQVWRDGDYRNPGRYFIAKQLDGGAQAPTDDPMARVVMIACDAHGTPLVNAVTGMTKIRADRLAKGHWVYQGEAPAHALAVMALDSTVRVGAVLFQGDVYPTPEGVATGGGN